MKKASNIVLKVLVSGFIAIVVLSLFSLVYFHTGIHIDNETGATDYVWESKQLTTNMTEGFSWITLDEAGFNNSDENYQKAITEGIDVLIIGSSHMEATEVAEDENLGYLLSERFPEKNIYNIGMSGHDIYRIVDNAQAAAKTYSPREFIIFETDIVELEETEMQEVINGTAKIIPSYDSGLLYYMQKIPAIKWLYECLTDWISQSDSALKTRESTEDQEKGMSSTYEDTLSQFLGMCAKACEESGSQPVFFYHPKAEILENGTVVFPTDSAYLELFEKACVQNGILFVDMTDDFYENYEKNYILPHGFENSYVGTGHLNKYGHQMIAERLEEIIAQCR